MFGASIDCHHLDFLGKKKFQVCLGWKLELTFKNCRADRSETRVSQGY